MSKAFNNIFCVVVFVFSVCSVINAQKGNSCQTPNNETAICINILKCETLIKSLKNLTKENQKFLQESQCGFDTDNRPLVCCGYKGNYNKINFQSIIFNTLPINYKAQQLLPSEKTCGSQAFQDRVFYGNETTIDEFPWMALLGYRHKYGDFVDWNCGGVLISNKYVLTAAHCAKNWELYKVRLGEHNIKSEKDCVTSNENIEDCNDPPVDYLVEDIIIHPEYFFNGSININDIALIRLQEEVNFTFFIKPICVPINGSRPKPGSKVWVAGWGRTEQNINSPVKLKADLTVTENEFCVESYKKYKAEIKGDSQICALGENGKDSCKGDSGGPLMRSISTTDEVWYVAGLVSFGPSYCGTDNVPGVYTDVFHYIRWILESLEV